jgi:hypothetical protein
VLHQAQLAELMQGVAGRLGQQDTVELLVDPFLTDRRELNRLTGNGTLRLRLQGEVELRGEADPTQ